MRYTNIVDFISALIAARQAANETDAYCMRIGPNEQGATENFNTYFPGTWPAQIFAEGHYSDVGYLECAELGAAQDARETLAGRDLFFADWTP